MRQASEGTHVICTLIPTVEASNWTSPVNNFRQNVQPEGEFADGRRRAVLPLELLVLLELHYWESLSAEEAAEIVGIPLGTAKTRIRRGRQLLREHIAALGSSAALVRSTLSDLQTWARGIGGLLGRPT